MFDGLIEMSLAIIEICQHFLNSWMLLRRWDSPIYYNRWNWIRNWRSHFFACSIQLSFNSPSQKRYPSKRLATSGFLVKSNLICFQLVATSTNQLIYIKTSLGIDFYVVDKICNNCIGCDSFWSSHCIYLIRDFYGRDHTVLWIWIRGSLSVSKPLKISFVAEPMLMNSYSLVPVETLVKSSLKWRSWDDDDGDIMIMNRGSC